jgi:hypothetical protein
VIVRPYKHRDRASVLRLAERLQEAVAPWRDAAAVRAAVEGWVSEAVDGGHLTGRQSSSRSKTAGLSVSS